MSTIKIFGHKIPDTDTTCSAIIWAWFLSEVKKTEAKPYILGSLNKETQMVLKKWNTPVPELLPPLTPEDQVVILDTNSAKQLPDNINETQIIQIIDHHQLDGSLKTKSPIEVLIKPLACTTTILYQEIIKETQNIPKDILGLILSAILSDTLGFRSPTCTPVDKSLAETLAANLNIDLESYALSMFDAKSDISDLTPKQIVEYDFKPFLIKGKSTMVSTLENTNPKPLLKRKEEIIQALSEVQESQNFEAVYFFIIDILEGDAYLIFHNEETKEEIQSCFKSSPYEENVLFLPGIISRKKQIIPALEG